MQGYKICTLEQNAFVYTDTQWTRGLVIVWVRMHETAKGGRCSFEWELLGPTNTLHDAVGVLLYIRSCHVPYCVGCSSHSYGHFDLLYLRISDLKSEWEIQQSATTLFGAHFLAYWNAQEPGYCTLSWPRNFFSESPFSWLSDLLEVFQLPGDMKNTLMRQRMRGLLLWK